MHREEPHVSLDAVEAGHLRLLIKDANLEWAHYVRLSSGVLFGRERG